MRNSRSKGEIAKKFPFLVYVVSYQLESEQFKPQSGPHSVEDDILNRISNRCKVRFISKEYPPTLSFNSFISKIMKVDDEDSRTYIISIFSNKIDIEKETIPYDLDKLSPQIHRLFNTFPKNPVSTFMIVTGYLHKLEDSLKKLEKYSHLSNKPILSAGLIKNHVLAVLKEDAEGVNSSLYYNLLLFSFEKIVDKVRDRSVIEFNTFIENIAHYASLIGRLNKLFQERVVIFKQIESAEKNTQERIQEILGNIRRPPDKVRPTDLESMLTEVSGIFSRLTTIASSVRRDHIKARSYLHRIKGIFNVWDEKPVANSPTNSSIEQSRFEGMANSFTDNVERLQALRDQLNTVLDTIRTYVGIQQQNVSVDEQRNTKKLLSRMVNLQEVLHKLEILIVAFYITEMGRLVFETIAHDIANILTIAFIPAALLLAIGIKKLLHRQGQVRERNS